MHTHISDWGHLKGFEGESGIYLLVIDRNAKTYKIDEAVDFWKQEMENEKTYIIGGNHYNTTTEAAENEGLEIIHNYGSADDGGVLCRRIKHRYAGGVIWKTENEYVIFGPPSNYGCKVIINED